MDNFISLAFYAFISYTLAQLEILLITDLGRSFLGYNALTDFPMILKVFLGEFLAVFSALLIRLLSKPLNSNVYMCLLRTWCSYFDYWNIPVNRFTIILFLQRYFVFCFGITTLMALIPVCFAAVLTLGISYYVPGAHPWLPDNLLSAESLQVLAFNANTNAGLTFDPLFDLPNNSNAVQHYSSSFSISESTELLEKRSYTRYIIISCVVLLVVIRAITLQ